MHPPALALIGATLMLLGLSACAAAYADEPKCIPVSAAVAAAEQLGGHLIDLVDVPGKDADQLLIAVANGAVQAWPVKDGCMVSQSVPLLLARDAGTPA
jgi:hypothetical protein